MNRSKKKRGISLSHHICHGQSPPHTLVQSQVRQVPFKPSFTSTSTPKDLRFSMQEKPKVVFNYSINQINQTEKRGPACINDFSFGSLINKTPKNKLSLFKNTHANQEGSNTRSNQYCSKSKETPSHRLSLISPTRGNAEHHTQKSSYLQIKQNGMNQKRESLRQVYKKQEYEKMVLGHRKYDTQNFSHYGNNDQGQHYPNTSSFSKIQISQAARGHRKRPITTARQTSRLSNQDLQSLKELQKRLIQIISV